jgi:hypothetical protein
MFDGEYAVYQQGDLNSGLTRGVVGFFLKAKRTMYVWNGSEKDFRQQK